MPNVVATDKCYYPPESRTVLAANRGDVVPLELAEKYDWPVAKPGTKAAAKATGSESD